MYSYIVCTQRGAYELFNNKHRALNCAEWISQFDYTWVVQGNFNEASVATGKSYQIWEGYPDE